MGKNAVADFGIHKTRPAERRVQKLNSLTVDLKLMDAKPMMLQVELFMGVCCPPSSGTSYITSLPFIQGESGRKSFIYKYVPTSVYFVRLEGDST
jgi:hypothetical protein